jgi:BirA family transcriptional regulator, biotin operon repressor / biotin---[acetyl-CoA-carboxylase] ligase
LPQAPATIPADTAFIELQTVDSTNNYARQQIHAEMARHGMAIFTHEQMAGKGQRGKAWASEKDNNIALSILIKPEGISINNQFWLSACAAVALQEFFSRYAGDATKIKWPNDLYWQDRKAGGILIESILIGEATANTGEQISSPKWNWAIVGMGININQTSFNPSLPNPVSLKQITGKPFDPIILAKELCIIFKKHYNELVTNGFDELYAQYNSLLYKKDETVKLKKENRLFEVVIKEVSPAGKLVTQHAIEEEFGFGEVEWVINL